MRWAVGSTHPALHPSRAPIDLLQLAPTSSPPHPNQHTKTALALQIWDMFVRCTDASLDFEDRFAIFCDQLGDFLEVLVQRAVDVLELFFQLDAAEQQVRGG